MAQLGTWLWARLVPGSLFGQLALLLFTAMLTGHLLALGLMLQLWPDMLVSASRPGPTSEVVAREMADSLLPAFSFAETLGTLASYFRVEFWLDLCARLLVLTLAAGLGALWLLSPVRRMIRTGKNSYPCKRLRGTGSDKSRETGRPVKPMSAEKWRQLLCEDDFFVAAMSHDLRAPLTRLALRVSSLSDEEQQRGFWRDIGEMNTMITSTLHYLRGAPDPEPFVALDLVSLLTSVADDQVACGHDVRIITTTPPQLCAPLRTQTSSLRRCIGNLVDNAVRYGGSAEICYEDATDHICIEIRDHGPGIPDDELDKVLTPFYRLPGAHRRQNGGVGLGLAIANTIVQRLQGQLSLRNGAGGGLVVTVTLLR